MAAESASALVRVGIPLRYSSNQAYLSYCDIDIRKRINLEEIVGSGYCHWSPSTVHMRSLQHPKRDFSSRSPINSDYMSFFFILAFQVSYIATTLKLWPKKHTAVYQGKVHRNMCNR